MNKRIILLLVIIGLVAAFIYFRGRKKSEDSNDSFQKDYEGDNYTGTQYYVGDKNFYLNDKGRKIAVAVPSSLYKVVEPAYKLKYEFNEKGKKTLMKISHDDKPDLKRGSQLRVIKDSEQSPINVDGYDFVQTIYGNFVRLDKIKKIRD